MDVCLISQSSELYKLCADVLEELFGSRMNLHVDAQAHWTGSDIYIWDFQPNMVFPERSGLAAKTETLFPAPAPANGGFPSKSTFAGSQSASEAGHEGNAQGLSGPTLSKQARMQRSGRSCTPCAPTAMKFPAVPDPDESEAAGI